MTSPKPPMCSIGGPFPVLQAAQPVVGTGPERPVRAFIKAADEITAESLARGIRRHTIARDALKPSLLRGDPHVPLPVLENVANVVVWDRLPEEIRNELAIFIAAEKAVPPADPETAVPSGCQRQNQIDIQSLGVATVEDSEPNPIEPGKPRVGAEPHIPVRGLCHGPYRVVRKPVLAGPEVVGVLRYRLVRIQTECHPAT